MAKVQSNPVEPLLQAMWDRKGTDLHLAAGVPPLMRVDGSLEPVGDIALTAEAVEQMTFALLSYEMAETFSQRKEVDFSFGWKGLARFRGNVYRQRGGTALALRLIPTAIPTMDDLGLPAIARELVRLPTGLILVTGSTGSGKSTTLAAMIDWINRNRACHILTIEDPIEYVHEHRVSVVSQRELGVDTSSFQDALRSSLREDADVLLVGEMRDLESIQIALTIAETGHLVLATLHTNDTAQAVDRIVDVFPGDTQPQIRVQLAGTLSAILYQRLLPRAGGGLVAAFEVMLATPAVRNLIREGKTNQLRNVIATSQREGMQTMEMDLSKLVQAGVVSYEEATASSLHARDVATPMAQTTLEVKANGRGEAEPARRGLRRRS